jgi:hypothetical protein
MGTQRVENERHLFSREEKRGMGRQRDTFQEGKKTACTYSRTPRHKGPHTCVDTCTCRGGRGGRGKRRKGTGRIDAGTRASTADRNDIVDGLYTAVAVKASRTVSLEILSISKAFLFQKPFLLKNNEGGKNIGGLPPGLNISERSHRSLHPQL